MKSFLMALALAACALEGCAYPSSSINQGAEQGHLRFVGSGEVNIAIDGKDRGPIMLSPPTVIDVSPGKHLVSASRGSQMLFKREYEVGASSTIDIRGEN
jgi:hypothetical protein